MDPGSAHAHYNRGIALDRLGDPAGAEADFSAALAACPGSADFAHNRGFARRKLVRGPLPNQTAVRMRCSWPCCTRSALPCSDAARLPVATAVSGLSYFPAQVLLALKQADHTRWRGVVPARVLVL